ncbi:MAG: hypothetical protein RSG59_04100 [Ruthenibacterium sp.]
MNYLVLASAILVVGIAVFVISAINDSKKLKKKLTASFGKEPDNQNVSFDSIGTYHYYKSRQTDGSHWIDAVTWNDLDMDDVFCRINCCCTSVGDEYLYHILHTPQMSEDSLKTRETTIAYLRANAEERLKLQMMLSGLGKKSNNNLVSFINGKTTIPLKHPTLYNILALMPMLGALCIPFAQSFGMGLLIVAFLVNIFVYYSAKRKIEANISAMEYFSSLLCCCHKICSSKEEALKPLIAAMRQSLAVFRSLRSKIPHLSQAGISDTEVIMEYIKILFLSDLRNYNKAMKCIGKNTAAFEQLYISVGELDSAICILSFRESLPVYCSPVFHTKNEVEFLGLYHPLLSQPVANDAEIHRNSIITGSNASGKSTFIKAVAINGILAQTIYTCAARSYAAAFTLVITSMAVQDNLLEGDSYFVTEIKSLKRILDKLNVVPCSCFIDEILKGTNTIERIAASVAVLQYLQAKDCLCIVATHDIELTEILKGNYDCYHFSEQITDDGIHFDYLLKQGAAQTRNAIRLLHFMHFDDALVKNAENLAEQYLNTRTW